MKTSGELLDLNINVTKIAYILSAIALVLAVVSVTTQSLRYLGLTPGTFTFTRFNLDAEASIPNYFSTMILFFSAILLAFIAFLKNKEKDPYRIHWFMLSLIFAAMSLDEAASIHDKIGPLIKSLLDISGTGFFYYTWIIPAALLVILIVILFFKFWLRLECRTRILFAVAAAGYIIGAIGFEAIGGYYRSVHGGINFTYLLLTTVEESLEMFSIILFIYALLKYLGSYSPETRLSVNFR